MPEPGQIYGINRNWKIQSVWQYFR